MSSRIRIRTTISFGMLSAVAAASFASAQLQDQPPSPRPKKPPVGVEAISKNIWPKGTQGCGDARFTIVASDGAVTVLNLDEIVGAPGTFTAPGPTFQIVLGEPSCAIEVIVRRKEGGGG